MGSAEDTEFEMAKQWLTALARHATIQAQTDDAWIDLRDDYIRRLQQLRAGDHAATRRVLDGDRAAYQALTAPQR